MRSRAGIAVLALPLENRLGGTAIRVRGPGRQLHSDARLDGFAALLRGAIVAAGAPLGIVGTTGNARGGAPHLHSGISTRRGPVDPLPRLVRQ